MKNRTPQNPQEPPFLGDMKTNVFSSDLAKSVKVTGFLCLFAQQIFATTL